MWRSKDFKHLDAWFFTILSYAIAYPIIDIIWNKSFSFRKIWSKVCLYREKYIFNLKYILSLIWLKISSYATVGHHHHHDYLLPFLPSFLSQKSFPIIIKAEVKILKWSPENIHTNFESNLNWPWFDATNKWLLGNVTEWYLKFIKTAFQLAGLKYNVKNPT